MLALTGPTVASLALLKMEPTQGQAPKLVTWGKVQQGEKKEHELSFLRIERGLPVVPLALAQENEPKKVRH